jgi:hypothetical protein
LLAIENACAQASEAEELLINNLLWSLAFIIPPECFLGIYFSLILLGNQKHNTRLWPDLDERTEFHRC